MTAEIKGLAAGIGYPVMLKAWWEVGAPFARAGLLREAFGDFRRKMRTRCRKSSSGDEIRRKPCLCQQYSHSALCSPRDLECHD